MELGRQLGGILDSSQVEELFEELSIAPTERHRLLVQLLEVATAQAVLFAYSIGDLPLPFPVTPAFARAVATKYDTARTNRCTILDRLPSPNPRFGDILLFSGDAAKAEAVWGNVDKKDLAENFFNHFESDFLPNLVRDQRSFHEWEVESGLVFLHAAFWRLALDVSLGEEYGGAPERHFAHSVSFLSELPMSDRYRDFRDAVSPQRFV